MRPAEPASSTVDPAPVPSPLATLLAAVSFFGSTLSIVLSLTHDLGVSLTSSGGMAVLSGTFAYVWQKQATRRDRFNSYAINDGLKPSIPQLERYAEYSAWQSVSFDMSGYRYPSFPPAPTSHPWNVLCRIDDRIASAAKKYEARVAVFNEAEKHVRDGIERAVRDRLGDRTQFLTLDWLRISAPLTVNCVRKFAGKEGSYGTRTIETRDAVNSTGSLRWAGQHIAHGPISDLSELHAILNAIEDTDSTRAVEIQQAFDSAREALNQLVNELRTVLARGSVRSNWIWRSPERERRHAL